MFVDLSEIPIKPRVVCMARNIEQGTPIILAYLERSEHDSVNASTIVTDTEDQSDKNVNNILMNSIDGSIQRGETVLWLFHHDWCYGDEWATVDWALDRWRSCTKFGTVNVEEHLKDLSDLEREYSGLTDA